MSSFSFIHVRVYVQRRVLIPYTGNVVDFHKIMQSSQALNHASLDDQLKARDKNLNPSHRHAEGHSLLQVLLRGCEAIKFAVDWKHRGQRPGGKKFKTNFTRSIYEARTGRKPPHSKHASKEDKVAFNKFKKQHQNTIMGRNELLKMYREVCFSQLILLLLFFDIYRAFVKFGPSVLLDTAWDVDKIRRCSKSFHGVLIALS